MSDIKFIRKNGRIIPIKKKKDKDVINPKMGAVKIASSAGIATAGAYTTAQSLKESFGHYRRSAELRASARLVQGGSKSRVWHSLLKRAAQSKIKGIRATNIARTKLGIALGAASILATSGVGDFFKKKDPRRDYVSGALGSAITGTAIGIAGKRFGLKATGINELFTGFAKQGRQFTRTKINKYNSTRYRANRPKRGQQMRFDL